MANLHASLDSTCKSRISKIFMLGQGGSFHNFDPKLRNERFTLIWQFCIQFQICIFNTKNSKWTFSNGPQLMEKRFMANSCIIGQYMQKKNFKISHVGSGGSIPQLLILNWEMKDLHWYFSWGFKSAFSIQKIVN